jgi:hypothetical protein
MALKPNFFQAIAALTLAYQAFKYIRRQASLLEKWDYSILGVRLMGVTKDFLDLQIELELKNPSAVSLTVSEFAMDVYLDVRAYYKTLGPLLGVLISKIGKIDQVQVRLKGQLYVQTVPGVFAPVPFDITDSAINLYKQFN